MDFESATHGVSFTGIQKYKDELRINTFQKIISAINATAEIQSAVKNGWVGTAADNFIYNINAGSQRIAESMQEIEEMLMKEIDGAASAIGEMDATLVEKEG